MSGEVVAISLLSAMAGYSIIYWVNGAICNKVTIFQDLMGSHFDMYLPLGVQTDKITFSAAIITSVLAIVAILLITMQERNKFFLFVGTGISVLLLAIWTASLIVYAIRDAIDDDELQIMYSYTTRNPPDLRNGKGSWDYENWHYRKSDIIRGVFLAFFALVAAVLLVLSILFKRRQFSHSNQGCGQK